MVKPRLDYCLEPGSIIRPSWWKQTMSSKLLQAPVDCTWGGAELVVVGVPQTEQGVVHLGQVAVA